MPRPDTGTRQKLIDTATDLIWTSSYGAVSVDDICKAADVKKGSFYHYFPSKQALAITAMEEYYEQVVKPDMEKLFSSDLSAIQRLERMADSVIEEQKDTLKKYGRVCGCPFGALASEMIGEEEQGIPEKVTEMFTRCKYYMRKMLEQAADEEQIAKEDIDAKTEEVHDFITGLMMMARIHNSVEGLERDLKPGVARILGVPYSDNDQKEFSRRN
jgi:TetR/AcrR family transcriptional repressor of nem operon